MLDVLEMFLRGHFLFTCKTYCVATMHSITDRWTNRQTDEIIMLSADHTVCSTFG